MSWVLLTLGTRSTELERAVRSLDSPVVVVGNGVRLDPIAGAVMIDTPTNVGIPGGRDLGLRSSAAEIVGFLDDDAVASPGISDRVLAAFDDDPRLGAVALRLVDENGQTARRHVPRFGGRDPERGGDVALFLGGACAVRRDAYDDAGGYWGELFYGHEEVELAWRLVDRGWRISYLPDATVFHPRTEIGRHVEGWERTGRNRVMIARRTLPWPIAVLHVSGWLLLGVVRAPSGVHRRSYLRGWWSGWKVAVDRRPISWVGVMRLTRLGRPPVL